MNWLKFLIGLAAFVVAGCAAYFSVTGLGVLFSGASVSVMIMASALEFSKLIAATYLKQVWENIGGFLKWYLVLAVGILMLITSAGIFGYLSNAFQQQNLVIQQVDRDIQLWNSKIETNKEQLNVLNVQLQSFQQNQGKIIDLQKGNSSNNRLLRSVDTRDKQILEISQKIDNLNAEIVQYNDTINKIKIKNIDVEREVGGFRFVAEAFGWELTTVVKFFIFLIVFVFDPMAIALVIALNNLIKNDSNKKTPEVTKIEEQNGPKIYEVYGDTHNSEKIEENLEDISDEMDLNDVEVENIQPEDVVDTQKEEKFVFEDEPAEIITIDDEKNELEDDTAWLNPYNGAPYYTNPEFPWNKKHLWQNNQKAVQYWITQKGGQSPHS